MSDRLLLERRVPSVEFNVSPCLVVHLSPVGMWPFDQTLSLVRWPSDKRLDAIRGSTRLWALRHHFLTSLYRLVLFIGSSLPRSTGGHLCSVGLIF